MQIDAEKLSELVKRELAGVSDARVVEHIQGLLVPPHVVLRDWDYGPPDQQYPCWIILDDGEHSDTAIGYCEYGFGPRCPWGSFTARTIRNIKAWVWILAGFQLFLERSLNHSQPHDYLSGGSSRLLATEPAPL